MLTDPVKNIRALGLHETDVVADLGAGTGFYSVAAGKIVTHGKVYAVEIVKDHLSQILLKAKEARLRNVEVIWGDIEHQGGTKIKDGIIDAAIASNILFQLRDKESFVLEIKRILKPGSRLLIIDWTSQAPTFGASTSKMVVSKDIARQLFEKNGFVFEREINPGDHHYGMILVRK